MPAYVISMSACRPAPSFGPPTGPRPSPPARTPQARGRRTGVLEAIGSYTHALVQALAAAGFAVGLVNPRRIKAFRVAEGKRAKTIAGCRPHHALR